MNKRFQVLATFLLGGWIALAPVYARADAYGPPPLTNPITGLQSLNGWAPNFGALYGPGGATTADNFSYAVAAAGSLYAVGDVVTLTGGTAAAQATVVIADIQANSGSVAAAGSGGTNGACTVTATTGTGTKAQFSGTVSGGALTGPLSVAVAGAYTANPTGIAAGIVPNEPVTGCGLSGAQVAMTMGALGFTVQSPGSYSTLPASPVAQGSSTGSGSGATFPLTFGPIASTINFAGFGGTLQNTILGAQAAKPTTGVEITAYGYKACNGVTTGNENTCLGWQAGGAQNGNFNTFIGGAGVLLTGTGQKNTVIGDTAVRHGTDITLSTLVGEEALVNYNGSGIGELAGLGQGIFANLNSGLNTNRSSALGWNACAGAAASTFSATTCLGANTGSATLKSGTGVLLIGSGAAAVDTPANNTSSYLNIENRLIADTSADHWTLQSANSPTVASGSTDCGTGPAIAGNDNVGLVTVGSSTNGSKCTVTFHTTWATIPVCFAQDQTTGNLLHPVPALTTLTINGTLTAGDKLSYYCKGYAL